MSKSHAGPATRPRTPRFPGSATFLRRPADNPPPLHHRRKLSSAGRGAERGNKSLKRVRATLTAGPGFRGPIGRAGVGGKGGTARLGSKSDAGRPTVGGRFTIVFEKRFARKRRLFLKESFPKHRFQERGGISQKYTLTLPEYSLKIVISFHEHRKYRSAEKTVLFGACCFASKDW